MSPARERRVERRVPTFLRVLVLDPTDALEQPYQAWLVNQSVRGVCLSLHRTSVVDAGSLLLFQGVSIYGTLPWVEVLVCNSRSHGGLQQLGCQFLHGVGWERQLSCG